MTAIDPPTTPCDGTTRRSGHRRMGAVAVLVTLAMIAAACADAPPAPLSLGEVTLTEAEFLYGRNVEPTPDVTYQDDVIVIRNGADAVRIVTHGGIRWVLDATAPGVDQIDVDKVMFLTSVGVGRVLSAERDGNDLEVIIGPVDLTELIYEGELAWYDVPVDAETMIFQDTGELPWTVTDPGPAGDIDEPAEGPDDAPADGGAVPGQGGRGISGIRSASAPDPSAALAGQIDDSDLLSPEQVRNAPPMPRPSLNAPVETRLDGLTAYPYCCSGGIGVRFQYQEGGIELTARLGMRVEAVTVSGGFNIGGGKIVSGWFRVNGGAGLHYDFVASSRTGSNARKQVEIQNATIPLPTTPPLNLVVSQRVFFTTAFSARNSRIQGGGSFTFDGSFGFGHDRGRSTPREPKNRFLERSLLDSTKGVSHGATGIVLAHRIGFMVGLGPAVFAVGPSANLTTGFGVTRGSDLGSPLVVCRIANLNLVLGYGLSYRIPQIVVEVVNFVLGVFGVKKTVAVTGSLAEGSKIVINNRTAHDPDMKICRA